MTIPLTGTPLLISAVVFGFIFGVLLHRGGVAAYNVIVNQFRLRDFTVMKIMLTAVIVGGIGVWILKMLGWARYDIKPADMLAVALGAAIFAVGMVILGYCPGTTLAAIATGSVHAIVGLVGMLVGGILFGLSFPWLQQTIMKVAALGKKRLPDITGIPDAAWFAGLIVLAAVLFLIIERTTARAAPAPQQQ